MKNENLTIALVTDKTPEQVFTAVGNVRNWWSELIEGDTDKLGAVFYYHHEDLHRCTIKVAEFTPNKKIVWRVLQNYFSFVEDATEWTGTDIVFEISQQGNQTELRFTHVGLVPQYECFNACSDGWNSYIKGSLQKLINSGKGQPNVGQAITESEKSLHKAKKSFTTTLTVDKTPEEVFAAINDVRSWWSGQIEGDTNTVGNEFTYRYEDLHYSKQKVAELTPNKKIVWLVSESNLSFVKDKTEWNGTEITFEISKKADKTQICFTHVGLIPELECFNDCSGAWHSILMDDLKGLLVSRQAFSTHNVE
jgi:regulatory protein YycH of two-component signal transduction system YycFG